MKTVKFLLMALVATAFVGCNDSDDSTSKIQLDTPAPAVDESTITTTSATVTWSAISNAASYEVQLDGATVQTVTSPSVSLSSLTAGTSYTVGVRAIPGDTEAYEASKVGTCSFTTSDESGEGGGEGGEGTSSLSGSNYYLISLDTETYETIKDKVVADFRPNEVDCFLYDWAGGFTGGTCAGPNFYGVVTDWVNMSINTGLGWFGAGFFSTNLDNIKKLADISAEPENYYLHMAWKGTNTGNYAVKLYDGVIDGCPIIVDVEGEYGFTRDGEWYEIEVPIQVFYDKGLNYNADILSSLSPDTSGNTGLNIMAITQPDNGTMPQSLQIDAVFIYKK